MWVMAIAIIFILSINIIALMCLIVEKAIIFFKSKLKKVASPAVDKVILEIVFIKNLISMNLFHFEIFVIKYTPAVTKVEECTMAEIGVGALMAAGNQVDRGNWALLVILDIIKIIMDSFSIALEIMNSVEFKLVAVIIIPTMIRMSPVRLKNIVINEFIIVDFLW